MKYLVRPSKINLCLQYLTLALFLWVQTTTNATAELVDKVVAVVNDDIISLFDLDQAARPYERKISTMNYPVDQESEMISKVRKDLLNQMIDQKLADQETKRYGISVSEEEIDNAVQRIQKL